MAMKQSANRYKQKTNISRYQNTNLIKTRPLFLVCKKGQKKDKNKLAAKSVGVGTCDYFHVKISLKMLLKLLLHSVFSLIT